MIAHDFEIPKYSIIKLQTLNIYIIFIDKLINLIILNKFKTKTGSYTYKEIDCWANQRARYFADLGAKRGDHIGILSENSASFMISIFAANKLGAVPG